MSKLSTIINESKTVIKSVSFSNGGFIELQTGSTSYLKLHVSRNTELFDRFGAWRWIQTAKDKENIKLLREIRDAANAILDSLE